MMDATEAPQDAQPATAPEQPPEEFAIVEIFGHRQHAGRVLEVERFGSKLLRIDVPTNGDFAQGYSSHFYGGGSIFSFTPCDRATVERLNKPRAPALEYQMGRARTFDAGFDDEPGGDDQV